MLSILLVQNALTPGITEANIRARLPDNRGDRPAADGGSLPYLRITGALALRFSPPPPPPPDLTTKPAASAPPFPVEAAPVAPASTPVFTATPLPEPAPQAPAAPATPAQPPASVISNPPSEILPDDTRPTTRPEDFLPYFQFPGSSTGDVNVIMPATPARPPAPGQLPPSSATYTQQR
jgi:hypothetical protein